MMPHVPMGHVPYTLGSAAGSRAPIMLTHFDGAVDAGFAGRIAVDHLLRALPSERVVTFSSDALIDYRSHRPLLTVERWMTSAMDCPEIVIDLVHDDAGAPVWILHGPEPDLHWEALAGTVGRLAQEAGVELTVSLHGIPSSVPHTRPVQVHAHATNTELLPEQPELPGPMHMQASVSAFLQYRLHQLGVEGMALLPTVPYYVGDSPYPPGATAMLSHLAAVTGLALPLGELEQGAHNDRETIDALVAKSPEISAMISQLESTFDDLEAQGKLPHLANAWDEEAASLGDVNGGDVAQSIEAFLENIARREATLAPTGGGASADTPYDVSTTPGMPVPPVASDSPAAGASPGVSGTSAQAHTATATGVSPADTPLDEAAAGPDTADTIEAVLRRIAEREQRRAQGLPPLAQYPLRRRQGGGGAPGQSSMTQSPMTQAPMTDPIADNGSSGQSSEGQDPA